MCGEVMLLCPPPRQFGISVPPPPGCASRETSIIFLVFQWALQIFLENPTNTFCILYF